MTKGLTELFDLPSLDDVLNETDPNAELCDELIEQEEQSIIEASAVELITTAELKAQEHSKAMDDIYAITLKHGSDAAELAFDLDPARAPRMLEVAAIYYKTAMDAKNSKRDAQLKLMKLIQDQRKLELDEQKTKHEMGNLPTDRADVIMVEDRNELLRRLREQAKKETE